MCTGQENAIPNIDKTITATVVVQSSMPSIVFIAPAATSISSSSSSRVSGTSSTSRSSSGLLIATPTTLATSTPTIIPAKTSSTSTATAAEVSSSATPVASPGLTKSQTIAIAVSSVGGVALVAGFLLLTLCLRRRRQRARDSDMLPFQADPGTPKIFYGGFRGPMEVKSAKGKNAPRVPPRLDTSDPYMFSRSSVRPDTIGVAISPERNIQGYAKRSSRLLPDKPTLKLNTNQPVPGTVMQSTQPSRQLSRQSTATEFEEEDNSADTAIDEYYGRGSTDRILTIQEPLNLQTIKVIQPASRPSFHITNPDNPTQNPELTTSPESYIKPLNVTRGVGSFSRPRPRPDNGATQLQVPLQTASNNLNPRPITASSSIYSSASNTPYTVDPSSGPLSGNHFPLTLSKLNTNRAENQPQKRKSYKQANPYDRASNGSCTSFDSEDSSPDEHPRHTLMLDLSPVAESPASASGRSAVSYPKIAPGRLSHQTIRMVPPPPQPDFASVFSSGGGRSQATQHTNPFQNNANIVVQKPWQAAEIAAARQRRLSSVETGGTGLRSITYPIPQTQNRTKAVTADDIRQYQAQDPNRTPDPNTETETPGPKLASPFKPQPTYQPPHTRRLLHSNQQPYIAPSAHFNNANLRLNAHVRNESQTPSISSFASQNSTSSSLLAKRLGAEKALALSLQTQTQSQKEDRRDAKWRVLGREDVERAKEPGWRPQLLGRVDNTPQQKNQGLRSAVAPGSGGYLSDGYGSDLPRTPGWVPRLTPTRRGDELFLSVA